MFWNITYGLSFVNRLIVVMVVSRLRLLRGVGTMEDYRYLCVAEGWLEALGVDISLLRDDARAA